MVCRNGLLEILLLNAIEFNSVKGKDTVYELSRSLHELIAIIPNFMLKILEIKYQTNLPLHSLIRPNIRSEHFSLTFNEKDIQILHVNHLVYLYPYIYTSWEKRGKKEACSIISLYHQINLIPTFTETLICSSVYS